jgi:hypothetical protein
LATGAAVGFVATDPRLVHRIGLTACSRWRDLDLGYIHLEMLQDGSDGVLVARRVDEVFVADRQRLEAELPAESRPTLLTLHEQALQAADEVEVVRRLRGWRRRRSV